MNKNIILGIVIAVLVIGGVYWFVQLRNAAPNVSTSTPPTAQPANTVPFPPAPKNPLPPAPPAPASLSATRTVAIQNFTFSPQSLTVKKGDTVVWTNKDSAGHTVTGNMGGPASQTIPKNGTYSYTFNNVGTFAYHCSIHPTMTGTVVVTQ